MWLYPVSVKENVQTYISPKLCLTLEIKSKYFRTGDCVRIGQTTVHNQPVSMHELKYFHDFLKIFAPHVLPLQNIFAPHQYFLPQMKFHSKLAPKVSSKKIDSKRICFQKNLIPIFLTPSQFCYQIFLKRICSQVFLQKNYFQNVWSPYQFSKTNWSPNFAPKKSLLPNPNGFVEK